MIILPVIVHICRIPMKILLDFLPIVLFFGVYKYTGDIIVATAVLIPATALQMAFSWIRYKKIEKMQLVTLIMVVLLGGATILFGDKTFIQWKPTIVNWLFGIAFLGSQFVGDKNLVERIMGDSFTMPSKAWKSLNYSWVFFFISMGILNLFVAYNFSEDTWVDFKLFGMLGATIVFIIAQGVFISRHVDQNQP